MSDSTDSTETPKKPSEITLRERGRALEKIEQARALMYEATQITCDLRGWSDLWHEIGDHADKTKALWHKVNNAPRPSGHVQDGPMRD